MGYFCSLCFFFFFSSRRRHTRCSRDWSSDVCSSDLRGQVLGCGYHGWLDWCQGNAEGVPAAVRALYAELPFNEVPRTRAMIREAGTQLAAVVVEPLVVTEPSREWLDVVRAEATRAGAVLGFDEIQTAFRLALGGAAEGWGVRPDLVVLRKG